MADAARYPKTGAPAAAPRSSDAFAEGDDIVDMMAGISIEASSSSPPEASDGEPESAVLNDGEADSSGFIPAKIFVGGLSWCTDEVHLRLHFEKFGKVQGAIVMLDKNTDRSRGFGFVTFADGNTIDSVLACEAHDIGGRIVDVKRALPRSSAPPRKVTIYNLRRERGNSHHYGGSGGGGQSSSNARHHHSQRRGGRGRGSASRGGGGGGGQHRGRGRGGGGRGGRNQYGNRQRRSRRGGGGGGGGGYATYPQAARGGAPGQGVTSAGYGGHPMQGHYGVAPGSGAHFLIDAHGVAFIPPMPVFPNVGYASGSAGYVDPSAQLPSHFVPGSPSGGYYMPQPGAAYGGGYGGYGGGYGGMAAAQPPPLPYVTHGAAPAADSEVVDAAAAEEES